LYAYDQKRQENTQHRFCCEHGFIQKPPSQHGKSKVRSAEAKHSGSPRGVCGIHSDLCAIPEHHTSGDAEYDCCMEGLSLPPCPNIVRVTLEPNAGLGCSEEPEGFR